MKKVNLGEFEELVLLSVASLMTDAYSVAICDYLAENTGRRSKLGMVHAVLHRLEEKGFIKSKLGEPSGQRGGKRKRFYTPTHTGMESLRVIREIRNKMYSQIPEVIWTLQNI